MKRRLLMTAAAIAASSTVALAGNGIPVPTPRPDIEAERSAAQPENEQIVPVERAAAISTEAMAIPEARKSVRSVGPQFLPDPEQDIAIGSRANSSGVNRAISVVAGYLLGDEREPGRAVAGSEDVVGSGTDTRLSSALPDRVVR